MFETVYDFATTVPVHNSVLRATIMLAEILGLGVALWWAWEQVPSLISSVRARLSRRQKPAYGAGKLDRVPLADLSTEAN